MPASLISWIPLLGSPRWQGKRAGNAHDGIRPKWYGSRNYRVPSFYCKFRWPYRAGIAPAVERISSPDPAGAIYSSGVVCNCVSNLAIFPTPFFYALDIAGGKVGASHSFERQFYVLKTRLLIKIG